MPITDSMWNAPKFQTKLENVNNFFLIFKLNYDTKVIKTKQKLLFKGNCLKYGLKLFESHFTKEEFQHSNFGHARFSQRTYHYPHWKFDSTDSSDSDDFSKAVWDRIRRQRYQKLAQTIHNQTHFSRNRRKEWELDELKNRQESSRMDFYHRRRTFKTQNYSFGYETWSRNIKCSQYLTNTPKAPCYTIVHNIWI